MVEHSVDLSGHGQVLNGREPQAFQEFCTKHNLQDIRNIVAKNLGPTHTRWSACGGNPRWARLDRMYISHARQWLTDATRMNLHASNTLFDHLPVFVELEMKTLDGAEGRLSLSGPTTSKWNLAILGKETVNASIQKIWRKLQNSCFGVLEEDPRKIYHKGMMKTRKMLRAKQK